MTLKAHFRAKMTFEGHPLSLKLHFSGEDFYLFFINFVAGGKITTAKRVFQ